MEQGEAQKLLAMEEELGRVVVGQEGSWTALCKHCAARSGFERPAAADWHFALLGPTEWERRCWPKTLAEQMLATPSPLIQLDIEREYMEKFTVSLLVGSPRAMWAYEEWFN